MAKKLKLMEIAKTAAFTAAGGYGGNMIDNLVEDKIEDSTTEVGVKLLMLGIGSYAASVTKGAIRDGIVAATGAIGNGTIESVQRMLEDKDKPTKGVESELEGIYDELREAMNGANDVNVSGANDVNVSGENSTVITNAEYD